MSVVEIKKLTKIYSNSKIGLSLIDLDLSPGEILGIAGEPHSGKSTLLSILAKKNNHTSGSIEYMDDIKIGYFSNDITLPKKMKIFDFLFLAFQLQKINKANTYIVIINLLKKFNLDQSASLKIAELSYFEKTKLILIVCFLNNPNLLLLDEPFFGLDDYEIEQLIISIKEILHRDMSCIISDDKLNNIESIATSIGLMFEGNLIYKSDILSYSRFAGRKIIVLYAEGNLIKFEEKLVYFMLKKELSYKRDGSIFKITFFSNKDLEDAFFFLSDLIKRVGLTIRYMSSVASKVDIQLVDLVQGRLQLGRPHFQSLLENIDALEAKLEENE
ncbi:MAG: ATP-binding cassette domain-containing protein [Dehalococcoidia bacterium]|jgi:ABC-2 type transport system ATP-binding protein|nr:MAG: ABC-2 type transport system ATP-binding protein [Chloroflexota bacterium]|tara:strand:+ start:2672 stop:3661 length:990 start_codon:yes stop_codon:yes gene_type:complete